ncbi:hypothetical protein Q8A73_013402 [Channa argus]|nr:hypothetical protein Q8A73_013402 [Channa argus]
MSRPCNETTLPYFEVYAENENRYNTPTISYVKAVHVYVHKVKISVLKGGTVQLNGTNVNLPVTPFSGVSVFKSGVHYTVSMNFGVTVRYDGNHYVDIKNIFVVVPVVVGKEWPPVGHPQEGLQGICQLNKQYQDGSHQVQRGDENSQLSNKSRKQQGPGGFSICLPMAKDLAE